MCVSTPSPHSTGSGHSPANSDKWSDFPFYTTFQNQRAYYSSKSKSAQKEYYFLSSCSLFSMALVPVVSLATDDYTLAKYVVALLGSISTICTGLLHLKRHKDRWIQSRSVCQRLDAECSQFENEVGPYSNLHSDAAKKLFTENCLKLMGQELSEWSTTAQNSSHQK
ncbi:MAG: DUF4231 domain-containing protein [Oscillospiraceae bacterium]|nr:DUF4231 domain-containing protein [Oscillospiraceae bacterium]